MIKINKLLFLLFVLVAIKNFTASIPEAVSSGSSHNISPTSAMWKAVDDADSKAFIVALENGADPNDTSSQGDHIFSEVLNYTLFNTVKDGLLDALLNHGTNPHETEWLGEKQSPLKLIILSEYLDTPSKVALIKKLYELGAHPLMYWVKRDPVIHEAITWNWTDLEIIKALLSQYKDAQINAKNRHQVTPIFHAPWKPQILKYLLSVGANPLTRVGIEGRKPENVLGYTRYTLKNRLISFSSVPAFKQSIKTLELYNKKIEEYFRSEKLKKIKEVRQLEHFPPGLLPMIESYLITDLPEKEQDRARLVQEYYLVMLKKTDSKRLAIILVITQLPISNVQNIQSYLGEEPEADILDENVSIAQIVS